VISFRYNNANDDKNPVVLVTGVSEDHVMGYNINYFRGGDLAFRKYSRIYMTEVRNLTEEAIAPKPKKLTIRDLKIGDKFKYANNQEWSGVVIGDVEKGGSGLKYDKRKVVLLSTSPGSNLLAGSIVHEIASAEVVKV